MRIPGRRYRDEWLPNYYPSRKITEGQRLRISRTGKTVILSPDEDRQIDEIYMDEALFSRLEGTGHILTAGNAQRVFEELKVWQQNSYSGPALHIVVLTKRCNLDCTYCHMLPERVEADKAQLDLQPETARQIVRFILESPRQDLTIEFQGGEPFLNFPGMELFVEEIKKRNQSVGRALSFTVVSNLMTAKDEHLHYCAENGIRVSYTLNGPAPIHDHYRKTRRGLGSYSTVMDRLRDIQAKFPGLVSASPLCVIDRHNCTRLEEMIDFFYDEGFSGVSLIRLKQLGNARGKLDIDIHEFLSHYLKGLDYILEKNRSSGRLFTERMVPLALAKMLGNSDVGMVDWRNPCGDVSGAIVYDHDGEILPIDDARSLRSEFGLGNVRGLTYEGLIRRRETFRTMNLSLRDRDPVCRECPYNPYCGVLPVVEYARTGDPTPRPHESEDCLFNLALFDWVLRRYLAEPLPLARMVPGVDAYLKQILDSHAEPNAGASPSCQAR